MTHQLFRLLAAMFGIAFAQVAAGQTVQTEAEIIEAWLSSPHADSTSEAFRHWDTEGEIPGVCAVCHSTTGAVDYLAEPQSTPGVIDHPVPIGTTVECAGCHNDGAKALTEVLFPNRQIVSSPNSSAICTVCHQDRTSMDQVVANVKDMAEDTVSADLRFINIHYAAAASTQQGSAVRGVYQYAGQSYAGPFAHVEGLGTCASCHGAHDTEVKLESCTSCHADSAGFRSIRTTPLDILGDGNIGAGIAEVVDTLHGRLNAAIMVYAADVAAAPIVYSVSTYPYFFNDLNADGVADAAEAVFPNAYKSWTRGC